MATPAAELLRLPTSAETDAFFAGLSPAVPAKLEVRADADGGGGRGKGIFLKSGCSIAAGEVNPPPPPPPPPPSKPPPRIRFHSSTM